MRTERFAFIRAIRIKAVRGPCAATLIAMAQRCLLPLESGQSRQRRIHQCTD
jgi:hypothetical protein